MSPETFTHEPDGNRGVIHRWSTLEAFTTEKSRIARVWGRVSTTARRRASARPMGRDIGKYVAVHFAEAGEQGAPIRKKNRARPPRKSPASAGLVWCVQRVTQTKPTNGYAAGVEGRLTPDASLPLWELVRVADLFHE